MVFFTDWFEYLHFPWGRSSQSPVELNRTITTNNDSLISSVSTRSLMLVAAVLLSISLFAFLLFRRMKHTVRRKPVPTHQSAHFRKRDKLRYYAIHLGRRFSTVTAKINSIKSPEARQKLIIAFVKKVLNIPDERSATTLNRYRLPESFYEPDEDEDPSFPDDLKLMINSIRVFGHLDRSFFIEFCKFIQSVQLEPGQLLFHVGDPDDSVYVVQSGIIQLYVVEPNGSHTPITEVSRGGSIDSFISVLNVLSGNTMKHENMEAMAVEKSTVLKLPISSFLEICKPQTPALFRILQMITIRLQRLTTVAVQSHLGPYSEFVKRECMYKLQHASVPQCVSELNIAVALDQLAPNESQTGLSVPSAHATEPNYPSVNTRRRIFPLASDSIELNTAGEVIGEFEQGFDRNSDTLRSQGAQGRLEMGEVPSLMSKPTTAPNPIGPVILDEHPTSEPLSDRTGPTQPMGNHGLAPTHGLSKNSSQGLQTLHALSLDVESQNKLITAVESDLAQLLKLPDTSLLRGKVSVRVAMSGEVLVEAWETQSELYYIIHGELHGIQVPTDGDLTETGPTLFTCHPGDVIGILGLITGEPNVYSLVSAKRSIVASIARDNFYAVLRQNPDSLFGAIRLISCRDSPLLCELDFAIQWITAMAGKALYKKGDEATHVYVVLSGRLRQVDTTLDGGHQIVGESGRGDMVGFLEVVCSQKRVNTVIAIRDSEIAQIPALLLHRLKHKVPQLLNRIIQLLSGHLLGTITTPDVGVTSHLVPRLFQSPAVRESIRYEVLPIADPKSDPSLPQLTRCTMSNLRTIAILPTSSSINAEAFALELQHSLTPIGSSVRLTSHIIRKRLGPTALASVNQYRLSAWLSHQEDMHRIVFFVCNYSRSSVWNRLCIRQADCVLVLALGAADPSRLSSLELMLKNHPTKVVKALVLMYPSNTACPMPRQTAKWLNVRPWISHHYHIRCESRVFTARDPDDLVAFYSNVFAHERPNLQSDFSRLARYLTGEAIGLVLGGGGARGCAHIGVIRAFLEAGIPIDLIGGTSMGAFMSALWAQETRYAQFTQRARNYTQGFNSMWARVKDFTYPAVSIFTGKEFNDKLIAVFGDYQVEDLWIPSFYVTTDITNCRMRVHTQGSLWRYVRASMSLSGYLPPLCDPYDGSLLLDGGYINNVPADLMSIFGAKTILAVDVGATVDTDFTNYGDHLSGWSLLYNRFFGSNKGVVRVPNLSEIQARLAYISCVRHLEHVKGSGICHYLRPPIDAYMTLQFTAFEEILNVGYDYAKNVLLEWNNIGFLRQLVPGLRPNLMFDASQLPSSPSRCHSAAFSESTAVPSVGSWLTQSFDDHRSFVDLAETLGAASSVPTSPSVHSETESGDDFISGGFTHGIRKLIKRSSFHLPRTVPGNPFVFARSQQNRVAKAVYSCLHSAKHLVSQSLPDTGLFRRRTLSDDLCIPTDSSIMDSSDEAGHFSDAQDYPNSDEFPFIVSKQRTNSLTALHCIGSGSTAMDRAGKRSLIRDDALSEPIFPRSASINSEVLDRLVKRLQDETGYIEDSESGDLPDVPPVDRSQGQVEKYLFQQSRYSDILDGHQIKAPREIDRVKYRKLRRRASLDRLRSTSTSQTHQHSE